MQALDTAEASVDRVLWQEVYSWDPSLALQKA